MISKLEVKKHIYNYCLEFVESRLKTIKNSIFELQQSLDTETKSSAGDKHETGRAMLQIELEKAGNQLLEIQKTKDILKKTDITKSSEIICLGSLVFTSKSNYFIAISAGNISVDDQQFYTISMDTPMGQLLTAKRIGDEVFFRDEKIKIKNVV
jgi:hypothetical protein